MSSSEFVIFDSHLMELVENSKESVEKMLDTLPGIFAIIARDGTVFRSNNNLNQLFLSHADQVPGLSIESIFTHKNWQVFSQHLKDIAEDPDKPMVEFELDIKSKSESNQLNQTYLWILSKKDAVVVEDEYLFEVFAKNITDLKYFKQVLMKKSVADKGLFFDDKKAIDDNLLSMIRSAYFAGMGESSAHLLHSIGNSLGGFEICGMALNNQINRSLLGQLDKVIQIQLSRFDDGTPVSEVKAELMQQLAEMGAKELAEYKGIKQKLLKYTKSIFPMLDDIRRYSYLNNFKENVILKNVIENGLLIMESQFRDNGIEVQYDFSYRAIVQAQPYSLLSAFIALLKNSIEAIASHHSTKKIKIVIQENTNPGVVDVLFADSGAGIDEEDVDQIFKHGFTRKQNHAGFGLHTTANIIKSMGGHIAYQGRSPSLGGAEFVVTLSLA